MSSAHGAAGADDALVVLIKLWWPDASPQYQPADCLSVGARGGVVRAIPHDQDHDDDPFDVLTETKFTKFSIQYIPVWARYSPLRTRVEAHMFSFILLLCLRPGSLSPRTSARLGLSYAKLKVLIIHVKSFYSKTLSRPRSAGRRPGPPL